MGEVMDVYVGSVVIDVNDLAQMKSFWEQALGYDTESYEPGDWSKLVDPEGKRVNVSLQQVPERKTEKNRLHLDLYSPKPLDEVKRLVALGATVVRDLTDEGDSILLTDPEGNYFCVVDKSPEFLARHGVV